MNKDTFVEKVILSIYLLPLILIGLATIINNVSYGEAAGLTLQLERPELLLILIIYISVYLLMYLFYKKTCTAIPCIAHFPKMDINTRKIHIFIFFLLIVQIIFTKITGNGVTFSDESNYHSSVWTAMFNALNIVSFFPIYYVMAREKKRKLYWINIILFCALRLIQGWSAFLMEFAIYELFFFWKESRDARKQMIRRLPGWLYSVIAICLGGTAYKIIWPIKNGIRYSAASKYFQVSLGEAILKLTSRLTNFPVTVAAIQETSKMKMLYMSQNHFWGELAQFFYPLVPGGLMDKSTRPFGNIVLQTFYPDITNTTGTGLGIFTYMYILIRTHFALFIVWTAAFLFLFLVTTSIIAAFNNKDNDGRLLYYMLLIKCVVSGELATVFSYGIIGAMYLIILLILTGEIKLRKVLRK